MPYRDRHVPLLVLGLDILTTILPDAVGVILPEGEVSDVRRPCQRDYDNREHHRL